MSVYIPVNVEAPTPSLKKSATLNYSFSESHTGSLQDNPDVSEYLNLLKSVDINELEIVSSGLQDTQTIETIDISVEGVGTIAAITNVTTSNLVHSPEISDALLSQVAAKLYSTKQITITVSGSTNEAPMTFNVKTNIGAHFTASPL